ncbi:MAG TPA: hypothetical protein VK553_05805, partial [Candidatus Nitrosopolaris rasttigaisensis]|nr:hypothetical protein [Candidatus Nitrosopolaris rasttigaisensis]
MLDNVLGRCSDILIDFPRYNLSREAFAVFVVLILIGLPEIVQVHAKPSNNSPMVVTPLVSFKENSAFRNTYRQIANNV